MLLLPLALLALPSGCGSSTPDPGADYRPALTDEQIRQRIAALPHVVSAEVRHRDGFGVGSTYAGLVEVSGSRYVVPTLDRVNALLRQGRYAAYLTVEVAAGRGATAISNPDVGLADGDAVEQRYGPQPGDGRPPAGPALPTPDALR